LINVRGWGLRGEIAKTVAEGARKSNVLDKIVAEKEYGIKEEKLESPLKSGLYASIFYAIEAIIPLTPYCLMLLIKIALPLSFIATTIMLALMGFLIAIIAEIKVKK